LSRNILFFLSAPDREQIPPFGIPLPILFLVYSSGIFHSPFVFREKPASDQMVAYAVARIKFLTARMVSDLHITLGKRKEVIKMAVQKSMASSSLAEVIDRILDKGIVIDAWARLSLVGIEFLSLEARVVVAGVETYLKYAEAIGLTATAGQPA
jgi:hypothetical protein